MSAQAERLAVAGKYGKEFVKKMTDAQVVAIYLRLKSKGILK